MPKAGMKSTKKASLRDQLARKKATTTSVFIPSGEQADDLAAELRQAETNLGLAQFAAAKKGESFDATELKAAVEAAREAWRAECVEVKFRGLSPLEWSTLISEFTPPEAEGDEPEPEFDRMGYAAALFAAAAVESDLTIEDWAEEIASGRWSHSEVELMLETARAATIGGPAGGIPKG